jgi:NADPH:quinone reductase-like Zn-dependent oxidoreductase
METMMALRAHARGGPEQLVYEEAPKPVPAAGEVLVEVRAAAITFAELTWSETWTREDGSDRTPIIPSHEVSGVVADLGNGVVDFQVGDPVYGLVDFDRHGAAAQFVTVPVNGLAPKPRDVSDIDAASLPLAALTAWQALVDHAEVEAGEKVLALGAAGGVGVYVVQLARSLGAHVIATARPQHEQFVRDLGADEFIDVTTQHFDKILQDIDVVVDTVGGDTLARSYGVMRPGGRLVTLGAPPDEQLAIEHGVRAIFFVVTPDRAELSHIASLVEDQTLQAVVSQTFPLADGRRAFESSGSPRPPGKTVLRVR